MSKSVGVHLRSLLGLFRSGHELNLDAVDAVDRVNKEDEDEDESNLHPILNLGYYRTFRNEAIMTLLDICRKDLRSRADVRKELSLDGEGKREDQEHEKPHLQHEEDEHLYQTSQFVCSPRSSKLQLLSQERKLAGLRTRV